MFSPSELSSRQRRLAAGLIHRAWEWVSAVGIVSPDDARGRRFRSMGAGSSIAFPPGAVYGEAGMTIGTGTMICPLVTLAVGMPGEPVDPVGPPVITIGDRCSIGRGSSVVGRVRVAIGDDVTIGPHVYITDHNHTYDDLSVPIGRQWPADDPVSIGAGSWLGSGVVVLPGAQIGCHVTVAAGAVVRGVVPDNSVVAGVPGRVVRKYVESQGWTPPIGPRAIDAPKGWVAT